MRTENNTRVQAANDLHHHVYKAFIDSKGEKKAIRPTMRDGRPVGKFGEPVTNGQVSKIYVIRNRVGEVVYVGKTQQSIATRLRQGLNPRPGSGYHGYQWQDKEEITIDCFVAPHADDELIESAEAELVFLIRSATMKWPAFQTEIHFSNVMGNRELAERIGAILEIDLKNIST